MARPYDREATVTALVNAGIVFLLPLVAAVVVGLFGARYSNGSTSVRVPGPDYAERQLKLIVAYVTATSPFAMVAAWRTFVHAKGWLERGDPGWRGVLEAGAGGFLATLIVLLPGILTTPAQAPAYVVTYGSLTFTLGLALGALLRTTALATLRVLTRRRATSPPAGGRQ